MQGTALTNWAGNITFSASAVHRPTSVDELRAVVAGAQRVRALGSGHSFSPVADTTGELVRLDGLPKLLEVDTAASTITVSGGVTYGEVAPVLHAAGLALPSMGSLPHISVAGASSTGTHGSGDSNRVLAHSVVALELVTADGDLLELSRESDPERFPGAVVALGHARGRHAAHPGRGAGLRDRAGGPGAPAAARRWSPRSTRSWPPATA